jgi:ssDNA thymidine ADP-ribosyltransferase, DarT
MIFSCIEKLQGLTALLYNTAHSMVFMRLSSKRKVMQNVNYLDGFIYHMVHVNNIHNIFSQKALLSQKLLRQRKIDPQSIAINSVQGLRDRIFAWDFYEQRYRNLHSYVPFYLGTHSS